MVLTALSLMSAAPRSKQSIICHDPKLNRLVIRRHTFKQLQASCASIEEWPPSLEDVLDRYSRSAFLNIEVKVRGMELLVARAVKRVHPQRGYFISSFLPSVVRKLHEIDSTLVLGTSGAVALAASPLEQASSRLCCAALPPAFAPG